MTDYTKSTNFASKDSLLSGNPLKIVKGTEIDTEFNNIATAVATKVDITSGTINTPTITSPTITSPTITGGSISGITDLAVADGGTGASTAADARTNLGLGTLATKSSVGLSELSATGTASSSTYLRGDNTWASAGSVAADVQTFNSTATWTKPTGGQTMARIQVWAGGGGGGRGSSGAQGGGGGAYTEATVPLSYLASSLTVTVGNGGAGGASNNTKGGAGGNSSVALSTAWNGLSTIIAYGGDGGGYYGAGGVWTLGGGGGGITSAGSGATGGNPRIPLGFFPSGCNFSAYFAGDAQNYQSGASTTATNHGGGGTAYAVPASGSVWGGGGGAVTGGTGGPSIYGGAGGVNAAGTAPSGGGSGGTGAAYSGGAGRVIITCW